LICAKATLQSKDQQGHPGKRRCARNPCEGARAQTRRPGRLVPPKDLAPSTSQLPPATSSAAADLAANPGL
jgi:hypothetical protein